MTTSRSDRPSSDRPSSDCLTGDKPKGKHPRDTGFGPAVDVVVIGGGPAGLSAAVAAAGSGATVALIDAEPAVGGQFWRHPEPRGDAAGVRDVEVAPLHHHLRRYRSLRQDLAGHTASGRLTHRPRHEVWAIERAPVAPSVDGARRPGGAPPDASSYSRFVVHCVDARQPGRPEVIVRARSLVLATGAFDLQVPFPGWDLPGVMTAGGAQSLLKGHGVLAGRRVAVAGTGPFLASVAAGLVRQGARVPVVAEAAGLRAWHRHLGAGVMAGEKLWEGAGYARALLRGRVRYRTGWGVVRADGDAVLRTVTVAPIGHDGALQRSRSEVFEVDTLAVGWGFVPQLELPLMLGCDTQADAAGMPVVWADARQRSSVAGVYVAGEVCGVGGAALAAVEGELAGISAARESAARESAAWKAPFHERAADDAADEAGVREGPAHQARRAAIGENRQARLLHRRTALRRFADALADVYPAPGYWIPALTDETIVCRCEEVRVAAIRDAVLRDGAPDARAVKLLARPGMGHCQGRMCGYATECLVAADRGVAPVHLPTDRPVAAPIPLGSLLPDQ